MKKLRLWIFRVMMVTMGLTAIGGLLFATQTGKPYDERSYLLILSLFAFLLFWRFVEYVSAEEKKEVS